MLHLHFMLIFISFGGYLCEEAVEIIRDKRDVSHIKNLASPLNGEKFARLPFNEYDQSRKIYPGTNFPVDTSRNSRNYRGSLGGSLTRSYERGPGGYIYERPQGGTWLMPAFPASDDTIVVYPFIGGIPTYSSPSSPGFQKYPTPSINPSYLPAPAGPSLSVPPVVQRPINIPPSGPARQPLLPSTGPAISSLPIFPTRPAISSTIFTHSLPAAPAVDNRPFPVVPARPALAVGSAISAPSAFEQPIYPADTTFSGYNYDRPDVQLC